MRTHCVNGHELAEVGTYLRRNGKRDCRACTAESSRRRRERLYEEGKLPAKLPLTEMEANLQALRLRRQGLSYDDISIVVAEYHGYVVGAAGWNKRLRAMGARPRPYGRPYGAVAA